jgi:hypothetical protein
MILCNLLTLAVLHVFLRAILIGSRDHRTQFWKGAIQGPFHQSLVAIGPVVSEEKIKMSNVDGLLKNIRDAYTTGSSRLDPGFYGVRV